MKKNEKKWDKKFQHKNNRMVIIYLEFPRKNIVKYKS